MEFGLVLFAIAVLFVPRFLEFPVPLQGGTRCSTLASLLLACAVLAACGGGGGGGQEPVRETPPAAPAPAQPPTVEAPSSTALAALRLAYSIRGGMLEVALLHPQDGSLRALHVQSAADLGVVALERVQTDPLGRFAYLTVMPEAPFNAPGAIRFLQLYVYPLDASTGRVQGPGKPQFDRTANIPGPALVFTPGGEFGYTASNDGEVRGYRVGSDGTLTQLPGSPYPFTARELDMHPGGGWMLARGQQGNAIRIDRTTGVPSLVARAPAADELAYRFAGSDRAWIFRADGTSRLHAFDPATGALAPLEPAVVVRGFARPDAQGDVAVTDSIGASSTTTELRAYRLNPSRNAIAAAGTPLAVAPRDTPRLAREDPFLRLGDLVLRVEADASLSVVSVSPLQAPDQVVDRGTGRAGNLMFALDAPAGLLRTLAVDPQDGKLSQVAQRTARVDGTPVAMALSPWHDFAAVVSRTGAGSGLLTVVPIDRASGQWGAPVSIATGGEPGAVAFHGHTPQHLYVSHAGGIDSFVLRDGVLQRLPASPFPEGYAARSGPGDQGDTPDRSWRAADLLATPRSRLFVAVNRERQGAVSSLLAQTGTGMLVPERTGTTQCDSLAWRAGSTFTTTGSGTVALAAAGAGRFVYALNQESASIEGFVDVLENTCPPDQMWLPRIPGGPVPTGARPVAVAADPSGRLVYVANSGNGGSVSVYRVAGASGTLTPVPGGPFALPAAPARIWTEGLGRFVYTADSGGRVFVQAVDRQTGALSGAVSAAAAPIANMAVDTLFITR